LKFVRLVMLATLAVGLASLLWTWFGADAPVVRVPPLRVEVLNGCGQAGLAHKAAERLQGLGHDVVLVGDATETGHARSIVIDRRGRDRLTREFARRIGPCPLILEFVPDAGADLTLILGADWRDLGLFSGNGPT
jgi:hypothetical protein